MIKALVSISATFALALAAPGGAWTISCPFYLGR